MKNVVDRSMWMTLALTPMNLGEFYEYLGHAMDHYAREQVKVGNWQQDVAIDQAREAYQQLLAAGPNTEGHYLYSICYSHITVGMIWLAQGEKDKGFIYDLAIWKEYQGQGYGTRAIKHVEKIAKELGLKKVGLHVFGHNKLARNLYGQLGYVETNIKMEKIL